MRRTVMRVGVGVGLVLLAHAQPLAAQAYTARFDAQHVHTHARVLVAPASEPSHARLFWAETAGGAVGSAVGFGLGWALANAGDECDVEDLGCLIEHVSVAVLGSAAGAAGGTYLAGRAVGGEPALAGALVGSIAGVAAGLGVMHLLQNDLDVSQSDAVNLTSYFLTHGIVTALGTRLARAIR